jgi:hypothetical protein
MNNAASLTSRSEALTRAAAQPLVPDVSVEGTQFDWSKAVHTAGLKLNEGWVSANTKCSAAGAEEELAAFFCAYGL